MKFKIDNFLLAFLIIIVSSLSILTIACSNESTGPKNNIKVTSNKMIKGVDISSYAEVIEQSTINEANTITNYDKITDDQQKIYTDFNGNKSNLFKIIHDNGINSIRLRVLNDPKDSEGNTYGGGHNDINTDIWIANQAKKFGIDNVLLDFHYSDFWADPSRQWLPKAWKGLNDNALENEVYNYTLNSLKKFSHETGIIPSKVQIGNEITNGAFWNYNIINSTKKQYCYTSKFLKKGLQAVEEFSKQLKVEVKTSIHFDGIGNLKKWKSILDNYLITNDLLPLVDEIGITHYSDWSFNSAYLYDIMNLIKTKYNLPSFVSETGALSTMYHTNLVGDITPTQHSPNLYKEIPDSATQMTLINSIMQATSLALPDEETGFYWWEPAWILSNKSGWATREGIKYAEPTNEEKQKSFNTGNSWWNSGFFSMDGKPLPVLKTIKDYQRIPDEREVYVNTNSITEKIIKDEFGKDQIYLNQKIYGVNKTEDLDSFIDNKNIGIYEYKNESDIYNTFFGLNPRLLRSQLNTSVINWSGENGKGYFNLSLSENNVFYKDTKDLKIEFEIYQPTTNVLDLTANYKEFDIANQSDWYSNLFKEIYKSGYQEKLQKYFANSIRPEYGFDNEFYDGPWISDDGALSYWDKNFQTSRYPKPWMFDEKEIKQFRNNKIDFYYLKNNQLPTWPEELKSNKTYQIVLTKDVDFEKWSLENWKNLGGFVIKFKTK